jgi:hypothetical protein
MGAEILKVYKRWAMVCSRYGRILNSRKLPHNFTGDLQLSVGSVHNLVQKEFRFEKVWAHHVTSIGA